MHDKAETADLEFLPLIAATAETVADERELSVIDAVEPEKEPIAPIAVQKPEIAEEIVVRKKNRSVRRSVKKVARKKEKTARPPVAETDSPSELLSSKARMRLSSANCLRNCAQKMTPCSRCSDEPICGPPTVDRSVLFRPACSLARRRPG